ncbi:hypothetical protein ACFTZB_43365 [Rhodococcus sp. NPDC057014]|uniref:hypothetical protein n=1 Tax=Rhodococcus sp. NPDC057014 TaxID=3346000 RepID=UPI00362F2FEB
MVVSLAGGLFITKTGRYKAIPIVGAAMLVVGLWLFSTMDAKTLIAQNSVPIRDMGTATGTATLARNMGGSVGVALLGAIYASQLTSSLGDTGGQGAPSATGMSPAALHQLPEAVQVVQTSRCQRHPRDLPVGAVIAAAAFVLAWLITEVTLRETPTPDDVAELADSIGH